MSSTHNQQLLESARQLTEELVATARSDVGAKISAVDKACKAILNSGGIVSMASVRAWLSTNAGLTIAASTLMNRRPNKVSGKATHSPMRQVIDKYAEVQSQLVVGTSRKSPPPDIGSVFLNEKELMSIDDHQVRYKVQLLAGRVRNLETQLNQARVIGNLPAVQTSPSGGEMLTYEMIGASGIASDGGEPLDDAELRAVEDFLKVSALRRRGLSFDESGRLNVVHPARHQRSTALLSIPDFKSALQKVLRR